MNTEPVAGGQVRATGVDLYVHGVVVVVTLATGLVFSIAARFEFESWAVNGPLAAVVAVGISIPFVRWALSCPADQPNPAARYVALAGTSAMVITAASQMLDSTLFPISDSVDAAHHLTLVRWIADRGGVPSQYTSNLGEMYAYPFGVHSITAVVARLFRIDTLRAMNMMGFLVLVLLACALVALAVRLTELVSSSIRHTITWSCSVIVPIGLLVGHQYFFDTITRSYFIAQLLGMYLVAGCLLFVTVAPGSFRWNYLASLAAAALVVSYPLYLPLAAVVLLAASLSQWHRLGWWPGLRTALSVAIAPLITMVVFLPGRTSAGRVILNHEGYIPPTTLAGLGGLALVTLMVAGCVVTTILAARTRNVIALAVPAVVFSAIASKWMLEQLSGADFGSRYQAEKFVYAAWSIALVMTPIPVALGASWACGRWPRLRMSHVDPVALSFIAAVAWVGFGPRYQASPTIVSQADYETALWAKDNLDVDELSIANQGGGPYLLWVAVLGRDRFPDAGAYIGEPRDMVAEWLASGADYLLVDDEQDLAQIAAAGVPYRVLFAIDRSAVIERLDR